VPARVPGSVVDDLMQAGELPSIYVERSSRQAEWVSGRTWVYRTRVRGARTLEFEGVDYECEVFLDGEPVTRHTGMFTPFRVEIPSGEHLLAVAIRPAPESEAQVGRTSRVRVHKPRMNYGWDFCPRLVHQGIWRRVGAPRPQPPRVTFDGTVGRVVGADGGRTGAGSRGSTAPASGRSGSAPSSSSRTKARRRTPCRTRWS
jgi:beta-mannosidase